MELGERARDPGGAVLRAGPVTGGGGVGEGTGPLRSFLIRIVGIVTPTLSNWDDESVRQAV